MNVVWNTAHCDHLWYRTGHRKNPHGPTPGAVLMDLRTQLPQESPKKWEQWKLVLPRLHFTWNWCHSELTEPCYKPWLKWMDNQVQILTQLNIHQAAEVLSLGAWWLQYELITHFVPRQSISQTLSLVYDKKKYKCRKKILWNVIAWSHMKSPCLSVQWLIMALHEIMVTQCATECCARTAWR